MYEIFIGFVQENSINNRSAEKEREKKNRCSQKCRFERTNYVSIAREVIGVSCARFLTHLVRVEVNFQSKFPVTNFDFALFVRLF